VLRSAPQSRADAAESAAATRRSDPTSRKSQPTPSSATSARFSTAAERGPSGCATGEVGTGVPPAARCAESLARARWKSGACRRLGGAPAAPRATVSTCNRSASR